MPKGKPETLFEQFGGALSREIGLIREDMYDLVSETLDPSLIQKTDKQVLEEICHILAMREWEQGFGIPKEDSEPEPKREDRSTFLEGLAEIE